MTRSVATTLRDWMFPPCVAANPSRSKRSMERWIERAGNVMRRLSVTDKQVYGSRYQWEVKSRCIKHLFSGLCRHWLKHEEAGSAEPWTLSDPGAVSSTLSSVNTVRWQIWQKNLNVPENSSACIVSEGRGPLAQAVCFLLNGGKKKKGEMFRQGRSNSLHFRECSNREEMQPLLEHQVKLMLDKDTVPVQR